jgi:hypothetical protein
MKMRFRFGLNAAAAVLMIASASAVPVPVTNTQDSLDGSLRQAIKEANPRDTIVFQIPTDGTDTINFNIARHELEGALGDLGGYVNIVAKGDPAIVALSGFPSYETTGRTPDTNPPAPPINVNVRQGDLSGSFVARYRPDRERSMNEVQINTRGPNNEAGWSHTGMFSGGKASVSGIPPGTLVWVRVRTAGINGVMGAWSDPAKIMVV